MCDQCDNTEKSPRLSRRTFLALAAGATGFGIGVGLWSCRPDAGAPQPRKGLKGATSETEGATAVTATAPAPGTTSAPASSPAPPPTPPSATAGSQAAAASEPATFVGPCPNLGAILFPDPRDPAEKALATARDAPVIVIPRRDWTHVGPHLNDIRPMNGISRLTVHHTAAAMRTDAWRPTACELENIREFHAGTGPTDRHWADIAYHFVVDRAGRAWQARPLAYQGAHVRGHNEHNLGIVLLGNFQVQMPTAAQLTTLATFIGFLRRLYPIPLSQVHTHGELGHTSCPGKNLQAYMDRARKTWPP